MLAIIGFAVLAFIIGGIVGGAICLWLGFNWGKEYEASKYKPKGEWKKETVEHVA